MLLSARNPSPERDLHHRWRGCAPDGYLFFGRGQAPLDAQHIFLHLRALSNPAFTWSSRRRLRLAAASRSWTAVFACSSEINKTSA